MSDIEQAVRSLLSVMDSFPDKDRGIVDTAEMREICQSWLELRRERDEARAELVNLKSKITEDWVTVSAEMPGICAEAEARGYQRGVQDAARAVDWGDIYGYNAKKAILALLDKSNG